MDMSSLRLEGAPNFRDLGGRETADGRRITTRRVFRSGSLARLTEADVEILNAIPLRTVIDLRAAMETQLYPSRWPAAFAPALVEAGINPYTHPDGAGYKQILVDDPSLSGARKTITATYQLLPKVCGAAVKTVVDYLLADAAPLAFNCTNGRDRTGVVSMLLLHILGVPREGIIADYVESNVRIDLEAAIELSRTVFVKEYGIEFDYDTLRTMNLALEQNVDITFATMTDAHGSVDAYLDSVGVGAAKRGALREKLLEPA